MVSLIGNMLWAFLIYFLSTLMWKCAFFPSVLSTILPLILLRAAVTVQPLSRAGEVLGRVLLKAVYKGSTGKNDGESVFHYERQHFSCVIM